MAMFHKDSCWCCNDYDAHAIRTCKEQCVDMHMQDVGDAVTTVWPKPRRDLEREASTSALADYKALADEAAGIQAALKTCQSTLTSEHARIDHRDEMIRDLKDEIATLKPPQSTVSTTTSSTQPIAQLSHTAGPSSRPMAPLPTRVQSGLAAQISQPGVASRMDERPEADRFNDTHSEHADDVPAQDTSIPEGWEHDPNWDSDVSVWAQMRGPDDPPKALSKKRKKKGIEYPLYGIPAVNEKVTRDYLA
jgi:hypothetical protein